MTHMSLAHDTEHRLLEAICEVREEPGYALFRSDEFPGFYDGNFVELRPWPGTRELAELERIYCAHFDRQRFPHLSIMGLSGSGIKGLIPAAQARAASYEVSRETYLCADQLDEPPRPLADDLCIRRVDTPARWRLMCAFDDAADREQPWYTPEISAMLSRRRERVSSALDIVWFYVSPRADEHMLAKLGVFAVTTPAGRVGRLQDVATSPDHRRRGLASALVAEALEETLVRRDCTGLYVRADTDDVAIHMYRRQGFRDVGELYKLFRMRGPEP